MADAPLLLKRRPKVAAVVGLVAAVALIGVFLVLREASSGKDRSTTSTSSVVQSSAIPTSPTLGTSLDGVPSTAPDGLAQVNVYFMRGEDLGVARRQVERVAVLAEALRALVDGPSPSDSAAGFVTAIPSGTKLLGVAIQNRTATVDLSQRFASGGGSQSMFSRLAQLTWTATQFPTVQRVKLRIGGQDVPTFSAEGIELPETLTRSDEMFESALPAILVESPSPGEVVERRFLVAGSSNTFEAGHVLRVVDAAGLQLYEAAVTATSGSGTRGIWRQEVEVPQGTSGKVTLSAYEPSPKDGRPLSQVDIPLVIR